MLDTYLLLGLLLDLVGQLLGRTITVELIVANIASPNVALDISARR
jgi:hypothetical protein